MIKNFSIKKYSKASFWILGIFFALVLSLIFIISGESSVFAMDTSTSSYNLQSENFADDSVVVVLDARISKINKIHNAKFFGGIEVKAIKDLTERKINMRKKNADFKQVLKISLQEHSKENVLSAIKLLKDMDGIVSVEPNYYFKPAVEPNDPNYLSGGLWGLNGINGIKANAAWDITRGNNNVRVGILDTGISTHADLDANLVMGRDTFNNNDITTDDTHSHGTHVAGTVGAVGNNTLGVVGVNWNVSLVPLQAANASNTFSATHVVEAINWAEDRWGTNEQIDIINYSVGGFGETTAVREAVREYHGLFIWAAGNETTDVDTRISSNGTFNLSNLISVGAINENATRRSTSNFSTNNTNLHIYAPGTSINSTVPTTFALSGYDTKSGTSMAAPHVTGVAALILSANPNLTAAQIKSILISNADNISITIPQNSGGTTTQSVKKLNAFRAVAAVAFTSETTMGGISITGFRTGFTLPNNTSLTLPDRFAPIGSATQETIISIRNSAFANQTSLRYITIPNSLTSIGANAFENCTSLTTISNLNNIQSIGEKAFNGCNSLTNISIPANLTTIGNGAFAGCDNLNISVSSSNPNYSAHGNILYNKAKTRIISSGKVTASVTIPSTVSEIGPYAFDGNNNLTTLEIENTPTIGMYAFANCENLNSVYFYSYTVPSMGVNAFMNNNFALFVPHSKQPAYNSAFVGYINSIDSIAVKITFVSGGENVGVKNTYYGATISDLVVPFKEGYDFSGWYDNPSFTGSTYTNGGLWNTTENMTLYAKFTPKKYYIIFDGTGSENLEDKEVTYDSPIGSLPVIEIEGYTFAGWKNSRNEYYTEDQIWKDLNNVTLTSDVFSASYIVTLDKQGGGAAGSDRVDPIYLSPMPSATAPTRNGYTFQGYFSQEGGTGTKYYNSNMTSAKNWDIAGDRTLYAYWIGNHYTITLNNQNTERFNTNLTSMSSSNVNYISFIANTSGTITLWTSHTSGDPYLTLYDKNLKILTYNDDGYGDLDSKITYSVVGGNRYVVGFRALSSKKTVGRVYYSGVSISYSNIFVEVGVTFGATMPTTGIPTPTKEGHTFIQYNTDPGGQGTSYYYGPNIASDSRWDRTTDTTLYAIWEKKQYTLSFVIGNNLDYTVPLFNGDTIMADELYVWKHKEFKGYYDGPNGTGTKYVGVKLATFGLYTSPAPDNLGKVWNQNANLTLYAYWVPMVMDYSYRIDVAGGGTLPSDKIHIKSGEVTTLNAPVIEGYTFESWNANGRECTNGSTYTFELHHSYRTGLITIYHYKSGVSPLGLDGFLNASYTKNPECVAEGTLITLADGSQKAVELLTGNEMLLVWNMHAGKFDVAPILFIDSGAARNHKVINLHFSDGTIVKVIYEHGFWNYNLNKYVFLRDDASQYIGQYFNKQITKPNGKIKSIKVQLVDVVISTEFVSTWSPVTYGHLNYYVNGMLSMPGATEGLINIFEVNEKKMKIDKTSFEADIETYGLFTYEEFNELFGIPQVIFEAFGGQYLKVSIGKGLITEEKLGQLIESYSKFFQAEETETDESNNNCNDNIGDS